MPHRIISFRFRQLKVTLPIVLAQSIGLNKGDEITWIIEHGELVMRKVKYEERILR